MAHWTHDLNVPFEVHDYDEFLFCRISHIASLQNSVRRLRVRQHINQPTELKVDFWNTFFSCITAVSTLFLAVFGFIAWRSSGQMRLDQLGPKFLVSAYLCRPTGSEYDFCLGTITAIPGYIPFRIRKIRIAGASMSRDVRFSDVNLPAPSPSFPETEQDWLKDVDVDVVVNTSPEMTVYPVDKDGKLMPSELRKAQFRFHLRPSKGVEVLIFRISPSIWDIISMRALPVVRTVRIKNPRANESIRIEKA